METSQILQADVLDIIFDDRNKEYGAYELRRHYRARLTKAIGGMVLFTGLSLTTYLLLASEKTGQRQTLVGPDINIAKVDPKDHIEKPPVTPPPPKAPEPVKTEQFTSKMQILANPPEEQVMPEQDAMDHTAIGLDKHDGADDDNKISPPVEVAKGIGSPQKNEPAVSEFVPVEVESRYPGGPTAWGRYLNRSLNYPQEAIDNHIEGTVFIQFVVDANGAISDVEAISGPQELRAAAVAVIRKSGNWEPALQNGTHVRSLKKQPVTFKLQDEQQ